MLNIGGRVKTRTTKICGLLRNLSFSKCAGFSDGRDGQWLETSWSVSGPGLVEPHFKIPVAD